MSAWGGTEWAGTKCEMERGSRVEIRGTKMENNVFLRRRSLAFDYHVMLREEFSTFRILSRNHVMKSIIGEVIFCSAGLKNSFNF
mmetsp:Transcript_12490/g.25406  ORF Transcript_12490/g.25406 Transcript_12490/m.25406 type:complete len:85 (+) Transcript_12490:2669-2923(+)